MCVACRQMKDKRLLTRVVRSPQGAVSVDEGGKAPGRGAYLCTDGSCLTKARKSRALERALQTGLDPETYVQLEEALKKRRQETAAGEETEA